MAKLFGNALKKEVTNRIVKLMEDGTKGVGLIWTSKGVPRNLSTSRAYRGINHLILSVMSDHHNYDSNFWLTYKQAQDLGGHVKKGEKSVLCVKYINTNLSKEDDEEDKGKNKSPNFFPVPFYVFNLDQIEGIDVPVLIPNVVEPVAQVENIMSNSEADITFKGDSAYYRPIDDKIIMPDKERFTSTENFYHVMLHELSHWTGHKSRLDREFSSDDDKYAFEELVAELSASFLLAEVNLNNTTMENHAAYLDRYLKILKSDYNVLFKAASLAEKASSFIMKFNSLSNEAESSGNQGFKEAA